MREELAAGYAAIVLMNIRGGLRGQAQASDSVHQPQANSCLQKVAFACLASSSPPDKPGVVYPCKARKQHAVAQIWVMQHSVLY